MIRNRTRSTAAVLGTATVLALSLGGISPASAEPPTTDEQKNAQEATPTPGGGTGYASSLTEEAALRDGQLPADTSPGAFLDGDRLIVRVFADAQAPEGVLAVPSRFTRATLVNLEQQLANLATISGVFYGFGYRADTDSVFVTGNLPASALPAGALESGAITFEHTTDGGRDNSTTARS